MGLDMYLSKKTYVKRWAHQQPEELNEVTVLKGGKPRTDIKPERVSYIEEEVAYWRKFNALHAWFVGECADGVDNCQPIYVTTEKLEEVLGILKQVQEKLNNSKLVKKMVSGWGGETEVEVYECEEEVEELFSPQSGFFFGSTEIDEWYKENVDDTIEVLENILKEEEKNGGSGDYYYQASW